MKAGYVYMMASKERGTLYIGVTSDLPKRIYEHQHHLVKGSTQKYKVHHLVYYECFDAIENAIAREKQLKNWRRDWKVNLIERTNPHWVDVYDSLFE